MLGLWVAEVFTPRQVLHLSPNNYGGDTPSAGEDASGALSDALLHESRCPCFLKKAKIESKRLWIPSSGIQFLLDWKFLLPWDHTATQDCLCPWFSNFTVAVGEAKDTFAHFTKVCHFDFKQVSSLFTAVFSIGGGNKSRRSSSFHFNGLTFGQLTSLGLEGKMGFLAGLLTKPAMSKNVCFLTWAPLHLEAPHRMHGSGFGLVLWQGTGCWLCVRQYKNSEVP